MSDEHTVPRRSPDFTRRLIRAGRGPPFEVGKTAITKARLTGDQLPSCPGRGGDFQKYRANLKPRFIRTDEIYSRPEMGPNGQPLVVYAEAIQSAGVDNPKSLSGLVVSRGSVSAKAPMNNSLILATGDVTAGDDMNENVVICDGEVTVAGDVDRCLIIARGKIKIGGEARTSTLYAGKTITVGKPFPQVEGLEVLAVENVAKPLGFTFFELQRVGLEVKTAAGAVAVAKLAPGKPGEKAGLKVGDTILEVNGKKPADAESLRRLLRDSLAVGDAALKIQRGKEALTVKLSLPE